MLRFGQHLLILLWLSLLVAAAVLCHRPAPWLTLNQLPGKVPTRNLLEVMEQSVFRKNATTELTETEINQYLTAIISGQQMGLSASKTRFQKLALDFEQDSCRVCLSWNVFGSMVSTADLEFTVERKGNQFIIEPRAGHYGRLPLPRGMMGTLMPSLQSLSRALSEELRILFQMNQIRFAKDKLILDPRMAPAP